MVTGVAVDDVEIVHLLEVVLGGISRIDAAHTRVETATQDGGEAGLLETLAVGPLPLVFILGLVERLIVGRVEVVDPTVQTGIHDGEVLIRQSHVDDNIGLVFLEQSHQLVYLVGIYPVGHNAFVAYSLGNRIAFRLRAAGQHNLGKYIGVLRYLVRYHRSNATGADNKNFSHYICCFSF